MYFGNESISSVLFNTILQEAVLPATHYKLNIRHSRSF